MIWTLPFGKADGLRREKRPRILELLLRDKKSYVSWPKKLT